MIAPQPAAPAPIDAPANSPASVDGSSGGTGTAGSASPASADAPGNNRLDTLENIVATGQVGLLFLLPGVDETLRVNGTAVLSTAAADVALCTDEKRAPKLVIRVTVQAAYLHCAKALMRSQLWRPDVQVSRSVMPSMGEMLKDQIGGDMPAEAQEQMLARYALDL